MKFNTTLVLQAEFLFEFISFTDWCNNSMERFKPYGYSNSTEFRLVAVDTNGKVCHIGKDFRIAKDLGLFPVKVYALEREVDLQNPKISE